MRRIFKFLLILLSLSQCTQTQAQQVANTKAAQAREAERKARCAQQTGWLDKLRRDPDCRAD